MEFGKVNQLDALILDQFYQDKIIEKTLKNYPFDRNKKVVVAAVVRTVYLFSGLWTGRSTEGNQIYNVMYVKPSLFFVVLHFVLEIFQLAVENFRDKTGLVGTVWDCLCLANWASFLTGGKYRTLPERFGKVQLPLQSPQRPLNIDYFYTKRAIFFQVLSDTASAVVPFVQLERILSYFNSEANILAETGDACVVCGEEDMVSPCKFLSCVHSACYYCYSQSLYKCPQCA